MKEHKVSKKNGEPYGPSLGVRRGNKGERSYRPSPDKFLDNANFLIGEFKAKWGVEEKGRISGGGWIGGKYMKGRDYKAFGI